MEAVKTWDHEDGPLLKKKKEKLPPALSLLKESTHPNAR